MKSTLCLNCFWYQGCKKTDMSCSFFQEVDMRWDESPNNKITNEEKYIRLKNVNHQLGSMKSTITKQLNYIMKLENDIKIKDNVINRLRWLS